MLISYFFTFSNALAQYPVISHLDWMQGQLNPAYLGINKKENLMLDYNRSWISKTVNSNLAIAQYDRAIITSKGLNIGGVGISVFNNQVNYKEIFNRFQAAVAAAYAFQINRELHLNFGLQGTYYDDRVNNDGLLTGSQYVPGWGFDPGMGSNEPMSNLEVNYFGISSGLFLYQSSDDPLPGNYLGLSVKNINRPVNSLYEQDVRMAPQFNLTGGMSILEGLTNKLLGELWYTNSSGNGNFTMGIVYQENNLISNRSSEEIISIRLLSRYSINNKLLLGGQLLYDRFLIGMTYDIPMSGTKSRTYDNGFEILLGFCQKVKTPLKRRKKHAHAPESKIIPEQAIVVEKDSVIAPAQAKVPVKSDSVASHLDQSGNARVGQLMDDVPLQGKVFFDFSSKDITKESEDILRQLISEFYLRGKTVMVITGHADNVGTNEFNQKLSLERAESVRKKLILFGMNADQVSISGKGEEEPLVPNDSAENRAKNRRVEIDFY